MAIQVKSKIQIEEKTPTRTAIILFLRQRLNNAKRRLSPTMVITIINAINNKWTSIRFFPPQSAL
jgi:hypothetical protein